MLSADKNVTLTEFQIKTLSIREKELNYFVGLYNSISGKHVSLIFKGIAAMLAGFGFSSLKLNFPANTSVIVQIVYLAITTCAIGLELCAILNSACCSVFGKLYFKQVFSFFNIKEICVFSDLNESLIANCKLQDLESS